MDKMFKVSAITAALVGAIAAAPAMANQDNLGPEYSGAVSEFFADSAISGNLNFWMRARDRAPAQDAKKETNLNHGSIFVNLGFNSGYVNDVVGTDFVIYSTWDMWNDTSASAGNALGHEMNFLPCDGPASSDCWSNGPEKGGVSFATAAAKFKFGDNVKAKLGYFQPSVPSSLGVNWSFAPGTYRGGEIGGSFGGVDLGFVVADEYKAPWYKTTDKFVGVDGDDEVLFSVGARYALENGISLDGAYAKLDERAIAHFKVKGTTDGGIYWSPQLYVVKDDNQYDDGDTGYQLAFLSSYSSGQYSYRAEATYTMAEEDGNWFAYRPTAGYGGSNGAYEIWWNNRSDFNHHEELAVFGSVSRDFSDIGGTGFSAGISGVYGFGSSVDGYKDLKEYAYSLFANYAIQGGALKDANVAFHYTQYFNDTDAPSWAGYTNLFQDETDFKLVLAIPFSVK